MSSMLVKQQEYEVNYKSLLKLTTLIGMTSLSAGIASANSTALANLKAHYNVTYPTCNTCHTSAPQLNVFGQDFALAGGTTAKGNLPNWTVLDGMDSDGDGITNAQEFANGTEPAGNASANQGTATVGGCITASSTTPLAMLFAMLTLGFFIRRK